MGAKTSTPAWLGALTLGQRRYGGEQFAGVGVLWLVKNLLGGPDFHKLASTDRPNASSIQIQEFAIWAFQPPDCTACGNTLCRVALVKEDALDVSVGAQVLLLLRELQCEFYRLVSGRTNFRAVCVPEKPTTFTSFKPVFRPAAITSFSVIVFCPLG